MLVQDHEPLERRCRRLWSLAAAVSAAVVMVIASGLRLDAAPAAQGPKPKEQKSPPTESKGQVKPAVEAAKMETLRYAGKVKEFGTGKPIAGATVLVRRSVHERDNAITILAETRHTTDADGAYSFTIPPEQVSEPHLYVELDVEHPDAEKRGELGTFRLKKGMTLKGRAFDTQGKPLVGLFVEIRHDRESSPAREILEPLAVSDLMTRRAETDVEGRFTFDPLPSGAYIVQPVDYQKVAGKGTIRRPLPGVFAPQNVLLQEGETPQPIEIRAARQVVIEGGWIDSKGKPRSGTELFISGHTNGQSWLTVVDPSPEGRFSVQIPRGIERAQIAIFPGHLASTRYRIGKDGKLKAGQFVMFGTLDHDVKDLQIVRYDETAVIVKAIAKDGRPIKDLILAGEYTEEIATAGVKFGLKNGGQTEIDFEHQGDGRFRATELTPDREVKITADADGFKPLSRKIKLSEGKTEEVTFVLEPN